MTPIIFGLIAGLVFGLVAVATMIPLDFADKPAALMAAFASRFAIGFIVPNLHLPLSGLAAGALVGFGLSFPDAIVTKAYAPILGLGTVGGAIIGWLASRYLG